MLRVFLVEDESLIRETLRDSVPWAQYGYTLAGEASDGEMALPLIRQVKPDVLITDIRMPFMDGLALSQLVSRELPDIKIIIISGYDDFAYAQQAIGIGVERFLLKPVTKSTLLGVLEEIKEKLESERDGRGYLSQFRRETQEYEQYARRDFFEQVVSGQLTVQQIYTAAEKLDIDLRAQCYDIIFFSVLRERRGAAELYSEPGARLRDALLEDFQKYPEYILIRWALHTYALFLKSDTKRMEAMIRRCVDIVRSRYETYAPGQSWHVAVGHPTQRLSALPACFEEVSRLWAYRYILPREHVLSQETVSALIGADPECGLDHLDVTKTDPAILTGLLQSASAREVPGFVDEYLHSMEEALGSMPFCHYLMLSVRFTVVRFVLSLGLTEEDLLSPLQCPDLAGHSITESDLRQYILALLQQAVTLRDRASSTQYRSLLQQAVSYVDRHFTDEDLSLNRVAREVNISPNYLSAVFSQELGSTFTEYVTSKRMALARELLRTTDQRSGEVAASVGYRDPHYFSFLFKKTQGCTPRDYRGRRS